MTTITENRPIPAQKRCNVATPFDSSSSNASNWNINCVGPSDQNKSNLPVCSFFSSDRRLSTVRQDWGWVFLNTMEKALRWETTFYAHFSIFGQEKRYKVEDVLGLTSAVEKKRRWPSQQTKSTESHLMRSSRPSVEKTAEWKIPGNRKRSPEHNARQLQRPHILEQQRNDPSQAVGAVFGSLQSEMVLGNLFWVTDTSFGFG